LLYKAVWETRRFEKTKTLVTPDSDRVERRTRSGESLILYERVAVGPPKRQRDRRAIRAVDGRLSFQVPGQALAASSARTEGLTLKRLVTVTWPPPG